VPVLILAGCLMLKNKKILGLIPARGGSKGIVRKNLSQLCGKSLLAWTIDEAKKSKYIDRLIISSDDQKIIEEAIKYDCEAPFVRPKKLAADDTAGIDVVLHAINKLPEYDYVILLQPTSPFRLFTDMDDCISLCLSKNADSVVSVNSIQERPAWMYRIDGKGYMRAFLSAEKALNMRQNCEQLYVLNGAVYCAEKNFLLSKKTFISEETIAYIMPVERSIDIDENADLCFAEYMSRKKLVLK
jgi:CMP-N,N'-diacetyllegionaminic acid synthase